ncbi:amino acid ABC transporter permease [Geminicoccaceae bacterium 1502E]|nr:amino acid ABC transporter permease [Geminicoccaceae bacterium 1502E]
MTDRRPPPARKKARFKPFDFLMFGILIAGMIYIVYRVDQVLVYHWEWHTVFEYVVRRDETGALVPNVLLTGLMSTLRLAFWGTIAAAIIGLVTGLCRTSSNLFLRSVARLYVELIRNIPPLVFIFVFYFFISGQIMPVLGIDAFVRSASPESVAVVELLFSPIGLFSNFLAGVICLSLFEGAYISEIVRAGIQSIDKGQWEAARAIGLSRFNVLRDVILPQAIRKILPPLAGQFITLVKDSAIVSLISIQELTYVATEVAATTTRVFETWIVVGFLYFAVCYSLALLFGRLEKKMQTGRR